MLKKLSIIIHSLHNAFTLIIYFTIVLSLRNLQAKIIQIYWMETYWSTHMRSLLFNFKESILVLIVIRNFKLKKVWVGIGFLMYRRGRLKPPMPMTSFFNLFNLPYYLLSGFNSYCMHKTKINLNKRYFHY